MKKLISIMLCLCLLFSLAACGKEPVSSTHEVEPTVEPTPEATPEPTPEPLVDEAALALDLSEAQWEVSADGSYYQLLGVNFCTNVVVEKYQTMNIYVPAEYIEQAMREDLANQTYLMNATAIMLDTAAGEQDADFANHWRTRNGTADEHTSFSIAYNLAMAAGMAGAESVDYSLVWAMPHGSEEGTTTGTFADWVHSISGGSVEQPEEEEAPDGAAGAASGVYTYNETNDFGLSIAWTLTLNEDGTYVLSEVNDFVGEMSYNGTGYTVDGDTVVCGAMVEGPAMFEWADPAGFSVTISGSEFTPAA